MSSHNFLSITSQVADRLRLEIANGRWKEVIPGRNSLAEELSVSPKTVECALSLLENEGILIGQGAGRRRRITAQPKSGSTCSMRIAILNYVWIIVGPPFLKKLIITAIHLKKITI